MSVLAITLSESNREEMEGWANYIASAIDEPLEFVRVLSSGEDGAASGRLEFEGAEESPVKSASVRVENAGELISEHLAQSPPSLLVLDHRGGTRGRHAALAKELFESATCDVLCLRFPEDGGRGGGRILVPTVGGANSRSAMALASKLVKADSEGKLVPLLVEADVDDLSSEVGLRRLQAIVAGSGIERDSERLDPQVRLGSDPVPAIHEAAAEGDYDLIVLGSSDAGGLQRALFGTLPDRLLADGERVAVGVFKRAVPLRQRLRKWMERVLHLNIPQLDREARVGLFESLETNSRWTFDFVALICLSTAIAGLGLMLDSAAVVIGAMLVAPLMIPLLGAGLSIVQGNWPLMRQCVTAVMFGFCAAVGIGVLLGLLDRFGALTEELQARGSSSWLDLLVAFLSGVAAAYCVARPNLTAALAGVAIAAALVPPIATVGITLAKLELGVCAGALGLFFGNVVFIILGAATSFISVGIRGRKRENSSVLWVQRVVIVLLGTAALLAFTSSSMFSKQLRLRPLLQEALESAAGESAGIVELKVRSEGESSLVTVGVVLPGGDHADLTAVLAEAAQRHLGKAVTLRLWQRELSETALPAPAD